MSDDVTITVRVNDNTAQGFRDVNGRLRDMRGRFASAAGDMRRQSDGLARSLGGVTSSVGSLTPALYGAAAALGTSLLPAIGAAAPAIAGLGLAAGTLKLGFAGVSDAMEASGKGKKEYAESLKKLSPQARDFTKALVDVKREFNGVGKEIQKQMLPGFTKAVKEAGPVVKILGKSMTDMGGAFGDAAEGVGRMLKDSGFKQDLQTNLKLGTGFVKDMTSSMGPFTRSFLDFGAKSRPTLDALGSLAGGLLAKGLPGMFKGLESGIGGAAQVLDGLGYALNDKILPSIGEFSGQFAKLSGPVLKQGLMMLGDTASVAFKGLGVALKAAAPLMNDAANGLRGIRTFGADVAPTLKDIGSALASVFVPADYTSMTGPLTSMADAIDRNKQSIQEGARVFGVGVLTITQAVLDGTPPVIKAFRLMSVGVLTALDGIVSGAAHSFGWIPGIGDQLKAANKAFDGFKTGFLDGLSSAETQAERFAASAAPKLSAGKLRLNINNWQSQIDTAKAQLKTVPPSKQAALRATIADLQAKVNAAKVQLASVKSRSVSLSLLDKSSSTARAIQRAIAAIRSKTVTVTTVQHTLGIEGMAGRNNKNLSGLARGGRVRGYAGGGDVQAFPAGGYVQGPGSGTSDSILAYMGSGALAAVSNTEYVVKAAAVRKYGVKMLDAINDGRLPLTRLAGGGTTKAEAQARKDAAGQLGISHFGWMAGWRTDEFSKALGKPESVDSLVGALNQWRGIIQKSTHGSTENRLLKQLDSTGRKLLSYEKQLTSVTKSLESARDKLNSLKDSASQLSSSVRGGILSSANLTKTASGDGPVTVASLMAASTQGRDKAKSFADALKRLQAKGLDKGLIEDIANAGVDGGGLETAGALLGASSSEIKSLNTLRSQTATYAKQAGSTASDAVYGAAIKDQQKIVDKYTKEQSKLTGAMEKLTKAMEAAIKRAFGAGGIVGAAASGGLRSGLTMVGERGFELLDLPAGSRVWSNPDSRRKVAAAQAPWASMLTAPRRAPVPASAGGSEQRVAVVLEVHAGDGSRYTEFLVREIRRAVTASGGDVQSALGQGKYRDSRGQPIRRG
ncbi:hypothetical protein AB0F77_20925 [Streptomyces sp. NPDC026672]|uniref:hypothetical protein n=1 Tax=unclassified Streptomyces TaxID=2593676 RepID=UPI003404778A